MAVDYVAGFTVRPSNLELVESGGLWHRIAWHRWEYTNPVNLNTTVCGLRLVNPPYRAASWDDHYRPPFDSLPRCQECIVLPPFWAD